MTGCSTDMRLRSVQMMGAAPSSEPVPELPEGTERWGLNNLWLKGSLRPRLEGWTRWFDLHATDHIRQRKSGDIYPWLCKQSKPVLRWELDPTMPSSVAYPKAAMRGSRLFCSTLDWMLALAIYEEFAEIHLYGWRMANPRYRHQVYSGQWWVRQAQEAGISVVNHSKSSLFIFPPQSSMVTPEPQAGSRLYGLETTDRSQLHHARKEKD